jgi:hypothetical protein
MVIDAMGRGEPEQAVDEDDEVAVEREGKKEARSAERSSRGDLALFSRVNLSS